MNLKKVLSFVLLFLFGLASLGQLERIEFSLGRAVYLHEITMVVFILILLPKVYTKIKRIPLPLILLNVWILITILFHYFVQSAQVTTPLLYLARFDVYALFSCILYVLIRAKQISSRFLMLVVLGSISSVALLGWGQYLFVPDTRNLVFLGWDDHYLRLISTFFDPGFTGAILCLGSLFLQHYLFTTKAQRNLSYALPQWAWLLITGALLFTYSRASLLAYAVGTLALFFFERRKGYLVLLSFFILAVLCLPRPASEGARLERTVSIVARVNSVQSGVKSLVPYEYLVGRGWYADKRDDTRLMGGSDVTSHNSAPENTFVFLFTSLGVVGLALYLYCLWSLLSFFHWNRVLLALVVALSVHALFSNTLFYPFVLLFGGGLLAAIFKQEDYLPSGSTFRA